MCSSVSTATTERVMELCAEENPLEVLSRAASMVITAERRYSRDSPAKELPTRINRERRHQDRQSEVIVPPKIKVKKMAQWCDYMYDPPRSPEDSSDVEINITDVSDEGPLDMTTTRRDDAVVVRPSVITMAPRPPPPPYSVGVLQSLRVQETESEDTYEPEIDDHFRRSLGKDYAQVFSKQKTVATPGMTVDDHFAKALGDTWLKLQGGSSSTKDTPTARTSHSPPATARSPGVTQPQSAESWERPEPARSLSPREVSNDARSPSPLSSGHSPQESAVLT